jgi:hypothetical protein
VVGMRISIFLPDTTARALDLRAKEEGRKRSAMAAFLLDKALSLPSLTPQPKNKASK